MQLNLICREYLSDLSDLTDSDSNVISLAENELIQSHISELLVELLHEFKRKSDYLIG